MSFDHLGLGPELVRVVADEGYAEPTPIQREAIPLILSGRDLLAGAQTGTGKTAAFVLPVLQLLASRPSPRGPVQHVDVRARNGRGAAVPPIRALVLTPTRELALQVEQSVRTYGRLRPVRSAAIYGGVGFDQQVRALRSGPAVVVATPGRLLDHATRGTIDLGGVEFLVLDEADRMLDMGFIHDIRRVLALLPRARQNLLFSATFSDEIRTLAGGLLDRPVTVDVAPRNSAIDLVEQLVIPVDRHRKHELLAALVRSGRIDQALVFTRTKHGANRLAEQLERDGIRTAAIHGNKSQGQRVRALDDFKAGRVAILVATDIAARGIDIDALPHVVNYELPMVPADYIHRIGRTGRAGVGGNAVSLVCVDEATLLRDIERLLRRSLRAEVLEGFEPNPAERPQPIRLRSGGHEHAAPSGQGRSRSHVPARAGHARPDRSRVDQGRASAGRRTTTHGRPNTQARPSGQGRPAARPGWPSKDGHPSAHGRPIAQDRSAVASRPMPSAAGRTVSGRTWSAANRHPAPRHDHHRPIALPGERLSRASNPEYRDRSRGED